MPTQKKIDQVQDLKQRMERATVVVSADYRGLRVQEMDQLRKRLRAASLEVRVVKNNLLRLAADQTGSPELMEIVEGPTALVIAYDDPIAAAKAITEYAQSAPPSFSLRGAFMDGRTVSAADLRELVRLPPVPVMLAQLAGHLQAPLATFSALLQAPMRELTSLLQSVLSELPSLIAARVSQLEASGEAAAAAEPEPVEEEAPAGAEEEAPAEAGEEASAGAEEEAPAGAEEEAPAGAEEEAEASEPSPPAAESPETGAAEGSAGDSEAAAEPSEAQTEDKTGEEQEAPAPDEQPGQEEE